ncbi:hypothetical protein [Natronosalvus caseinilyticus]|uniref:hypothetical protein n=1 Tax=Natronosalvus caseinilyticus TaxID=2953747 RepID=UPI0028AC4211|nr:hypothetical protein [Natronosalvus caseinilyticus]
MYGPLPSELVYVLIGAIAATGGSFLLGWYQRKVEQDHLKMALATEIKTIDVDTIQEYCSLESYRGLSDSDILDDDEIAELTDEEAERLVQMYWRGQVLGRFARVSPLYPKRHVYVENLSDIGILTGSQIEAVIRFYEQITIVSETMERVIRASRIEEEDDATIRDFQEEMERLRKEAKLLSNLKGAALESLDELDEEYESDELDSGDSESWKTDIESTAGQRTSS